MTRESRLSTALLSLASIGGLNSPHSDTVAPTHAVIFDAESQARRFLDVTR